MIPGSTVQDFDTLAEIENSITCRHCGHTGVTLCRTRAINGSWQIIAKCDGCGDINPIKGKPFFRHDEITVDLELMPVEKREWQEPRKCCVKGCQEAAYGEEHHWAPRALFGNDADLWPLGLLCLKHHIEWHRRVTPSLVRKNGNGR